MSGVDLKLDNSEYKNVPPEIANGVLTEFSNLKNEIKRLKSESRQDTMVNNKYELDGTVYTDMAQLYQDMCGYKKKYQDMMERYEGASAKTDALETELKKRQDTADIDSIVRERVQSRRNLEKIARNKMKDFSLERFDSLEDIEVKRQIVLDSGINENKCNSYSELQLDAVIEVLKDSDKQRQDSYEAQQQAFSSVPSERSRIDEDEAVIKMVRDSIDSIENAWKVKA